MTREEKERLLAEIEKQYKWLMTKSPTIYMMDIAFDAIRKAVREASKEQQEPILDKIRAEIETDLSFFCFDDWGNETTEWKEVKAIIDKYKVESAPTIIEADKGDE